MSAGSFSKTWNVARLTSAICSSHSIICWLTSDELAGSGFTPPIAAGALLASENDKPAAAPKTVTALLRRFRSFVCDMTLPSITVELQSQFRVMLGAHPQQVRIRHPFV